MSPRAVLAAAASALLALALTGCSGTGSAFGYGDGDGTGSTSSTPMQNAVGDVVLGVPLDNRSGQPVQLLSLTPFRSDNVAIESATVAPVLGEHAGDRLYFGMNRPAEDPTLAREWARRSALRGQRVGAKARDVQALLEISVRNRSRPARVVGLTIRYREAGQVLSETTSETFCVFPQHRASACSLP